MKYLKLDFATQASTKNKFILFFLFSFLCLPLFTNIKKARDLNLHAIDFSTYQQAIYEIAAGNALNPYVPVRNLKILNDHFDPAIYLAAIFVNIFGEHVTTLIVFEWFIYILAALSILFLSYRESKSMTSATFNLFLFAVSRSLLQGIEFPVHPTTWSILPGIWALYFLYKSQFKRFLFAFIFLCTFREIYYFSLGGLTCYFLITKEWRKALISFSITIALLYILMVLRPKILGPVLDYSNDSMDLIKNFDILGIIKEIIKLNTPWKIFLPLTLFAFLPNYFKSSPTRYNQMLLQCLFFIMPGILIHELVGRMVHHQSIPFVAPFLALFIFINWSFLFERKKLLYPLILFAILMSSSRYKNMIVEITTVKRDEKRVSFKSIENIIQNLGNDKVLLMTSTLVPRLVKAGSKVYNIVDTGPFLEKVDILILERDPTDNYYPLSYNEVREIEIRCRAQAGKVLFEDKYFIMMQDNINQSCLKQKDIFKGLPFIKPLPESFEKK
jgi:uncharacterized membrane protein